MQIERNESKIFCYLLYSICVYGKKKAFKKETLKTKKDAQGLYKSFFKGVY